MTELEKIKVKIKKLFALSKSPNANEAAAALEKAQELLKQYALEAGEINTAEISREKTDSVWGDKPPQYAVSLASGIALAFGCQNAYGNYFSTDLKIHHRFIFVGVEHRAKIAAYFAEILFKKLRAARSTHLKTLNRIRLRDNKVKRADMFCRGWVFTVREKLKEFTNTPEEKQAIEKYVNGLDWTDDLKIIKRKGSFSKNDFGKGIQAGKTVQLQHGINGNESGAPLLGANI